MKFKKINRRKTHTLLVSFNMYKGGSYTIYKQIESLINQDQNLVNITFGKRYKFNLNSEITLIYPLKFLNLAYRFLIEQVFVLLISIFKKPKKIIMLGNFPCLFAHSPQKIFFHNLLYIYCLKDRKQYSFKLFLESLFWEFCINKVNPIICVQSKFIEKSLENYFRRKLKIKIIGSPTINFKTNNRLKDFSLIDKKVQISEKGFQNFLYPANFYIHKNHKLLFQCSKFFSNNRIKIHLTFQKKFIKTIKYDLSPFVFYDYLNDEELNYLYSNINALIYPSLIESLGMPLLEITNYKKPVIAINSSYVKAAIDNFYAFEPNNESLCYSIMEYINDFNLKKNRIAVAKINKNSNQFFTGLIF